MLKDLQIAPGIFLSAFFAPNETVCLRVFADRKDDEEDAPMFFGQKYEVPCAKFDTVREALNKHNGQARGIFFAVNFGGQSDNEITRINAQFVEADDLSIEKQEAQIAAFPLKPSIVVKTRKSLHVYYLISDGKVEDFRRIQRKLVMQFHGDPNCINESRVLRLPGFYHCKREPVMVQCVKFDPELRYTQQELEAALPQLPEDAVGSTQTTKKGSKKELAMVLRSCDFMRHCEQNAASLPEHDWYAMITNLAVFEGGDSEIHRLSKSYPKYDEADTNKKVAHFLSSGTKPITCNVIAEKGFKCPRLNECAAKAPAALCYQPMELELMQEYLQGRTFGDDILSRMRDALKFVEEYMFNIDDAMAEIFFDNILKDHYSFKINDLRALKKKHKEYYKAFLASKPQDLESPNIERPWYVTTENGIKFVSGILAGHMTKHVHAFFSSGCFYFYRDGVYVQSEELDAGRAVREFMYEDQATMSRIFDTREQWKLGIFKPVEDLNCDPYIINFKNGLYDALDNTFREHTPEHVGTIQIGGNYDPEAKSPTLMKYLNDAVDEPEKRLIQEMLGYLLIPICKAQKAFILSGAGFTGKSTMLDIIQYIILGEKNVSNITWQNLGQRFSPAALFGKLANVFADLPSKSMDDVGMFKALTGEDYISAERKNENPFSFKPFARLIFSCNDVPKNYGDRSDAFFRRLIIVPFNNVIPIEKRDVHMVEKLKMEVDGILAFALEGLKRLMANDYVFSETEKTHTALEQYRIDSSSSLSFFAECCVIDEKRATLCADMYNAYSEHCKLSGLKSVSNTRFNQELERAYPNEVKRNRENVTRRKVWQGVALLEEE